MVLMSDKHDPLSLVPRPHIKPDTLACIYNPSGPHVGKMDAGHENAPRAQASQSGICSSKQEETLGREQVIESSDLHAHILYVCAHTYT